MRPHLRVVWNLRKWDLDELQWICEHFDIRYELLDPKFFINDPIAYINHLQNCYFLEKNG